MLWIIPTWLISVLLATLFGYKLQNWVKKIEQLEEMIKAKIEKPEPEEPKSTVLDPDDPIQQAQWEREQLMKRINGE
jgi:hypothetical protein